MGREDRVVSETMRLATGCGRAKKTAGEAADVTDCIPPLVCALTFYCA
jgi:hypothetical protein